MACFEFDDLKGRNSHFFPSFRVAPLDSTVVSQLKDPKVVQGDFITFFQSMSNICDKWLDCFFTVVLFEASFFFQVCAEPRCTEWLDGRVLPWIYNGMHKSDRACCYKLMYTIYVSVCLSVRQAACSPH